MFTGGAAQMEKIPRKPLAEFLMASAGPFVSLVLGVTCVFGLDPIVPLPRFSGLVNLTVVGWIGMINLALVVFNLLPAFPMDGGRIFRAALTPLLGRVKATGVAARTGQALAVMFGVSGIFGCAPFVAAGNWMLVAIAFFIFIAAGSEYRMVRMEEARRRGYSFRPPWIRPDDSADEEDRVIISPPPYRDEPDSETEIHPDDEWPRRFN
jgi:stage IV sporulation protein FB